MVGCRFLVAVGVPSFRDRVATSRLVINGVVLGIVAGGFVDAVVVDTVVALRSSSKPLSSNPSRRKWQPLLIRPNSTSTSASARRC